MTESGFTEFDFEQLTEKQRLVFGLVFEEGRSWRFAGNKAGMTPGQAKKLYWESVRLLIRSAESRKKDEAFNTTGGGSDGTHCVQMV